jgi:nicotinate-nucleotide pyrophosphorylase (carboxylating)
MPLSSRLTRQVQTDVRAALDEDFGSGDLTARLIPAQQAACAAVITRQNAVLCGAQWFDGCFMALDPDCTIAWIAQDGDAIHAGQTLCQIRGNARAMLSAERPALNFLQLLSATATLTRRYVDTVAGTGAKIMDTRKTLPGLRIAQKYAVKTGGGHNQRTGLFDGILIKENHILAAGSIRAALETAHRQAAGGVTVQIEVENVDELGEALEAGAKLILLDNFSLEDLRAAVRLNAGRAELEASGGVTLETVRAIAETGVERISVGSLTKDVQAVDLSMRFEERSL